VTKLEAVRARDADTTHFTPSVMTVQQDRRWLLARVDQLAEALRDVRYDAHGHEDDSPCGREICQRAAEALLALSEDEST